MEEIGNGIGSLFEEQLHLHRSFMGLDFRENLLGLGVIPGKLATRALGLRRGKRQGDGQHGQGEKRLFQKDVRHHLCHCCHFGPELKGKIQTEDEISK
jgi:hypothetical protein